MRLELLTVFLASPSDVGRERDLLAECIEELNLGVAKDHGVHLELVRWETHTRPGLGRPQELVNQQTGPMSSHSMFIGIMWSRFGTPTGVADSGTHEEFLAAKDSFEQTGKPEVMFYFSNRPMPLGDSSAARQYVKVAEFREALENMGLAQGYGEPEEFERLVRRHLTNWLRSLVQPHLAVNSGGSPDAAPAERLSDNDARPESTPDSSERSASVRDSGMWTLLGQGFLLALSVSQGKEGLMEIVYASNDSTDDAAFRAVSELTGEQPFAHGNDAALVEVVDASREASSDGVRWTVRLRTKDTFRGDLMSEMATTGYTGDEIAELRVRRILLNEKPAKTPDGNQAQMKPEETMLMVLIGGVNAPIRPEVGAIPQLAAQISSDSSDFLKLARLYAILLLRGSHAVGSVSALSLELVGANHVKVEFAGQRPKLYVNVEPAVVKVSGICPIRA